MNDFINEIRNDLKRDNVRNLVRTYLPYITILFIVAITVISISVWYSNYKLNTVYKDGGLYLVALNKMRAENLDEGLKRFKVVAKSSSTYAALAKLNLVSYEIFNKNFSQAITLLSEIIANNSFNATIRNLAELYKIQLEYESNTISLDETINVINQYIKKDLEFKFSAQEFLATLYLRANNNEKASEVLNQLTTNPKVPSTIAKRAEQYIALVK